MHQSSLRTAALILTLILLTLFSVPAAAQDSTPITPPPPIPPAQAQAQPSENEPQHAAPALALPALKAVLVVGPIDGDNGTWTRGEVANMELAAAELQAHGVTVHKFYPPNNNWNLITQAANGAHFFFYRGHGVSWPGQNPPVVGGMALKDLIVSPEMIRTQLTLHPGAVVMLYGCFTAGGSSDEIIGSALAKERVLQYASPFFDAGAGAYYADWFGDAFKYLVQYLFDGKSLGAVYESFYDYNASSVERYTYPNRPDMALWLDKDNWSGIRYNYAFIGRPEQTLESLFGARMDTSAGAVQYLADPSSAARDYTVQVSSQPGVTFTWSAAAVGGSEWLSVVKTSGTAGESLTLRVDPPAALGQYQAQVRIWTDNPAILDREQFVTVNLQVFPQVHQVSLPVLSR